MNDKKIIAKIKIEKYVNSIQQLLIKVNNNEVDGNKIPLLKIIEKFLSFLIIDKSNDINLEITSDFLVSVSQLILWKSTLLLPVHEEDSSNEEDESEVLALKEKYWKEYKKYQSIIKLFEEKEVKQKDIYLTCLHTEELYPEEYQENHFSQLVLAIESILSQKNENNAIKITKREYDIFQKIEEIENKFKNNGKLYFNEMINSDCTRKDIIITFLALLELICQGKVSYKQFKNFGEIIFYRREDEKLKKEKIKL